MADSDQSKLKAVLRIFRAVAKVPLRDVPETVRDLREPRRLFEKFFPEALSDLHLPPLDRHGDAVLEAADALAGNSAMNDDDAVEELVRVARRHRKALRSAEMYSRASGRYREFQIDNRAQRLLEAAVTGHPVRPPTEEEARTIAAIEAFGELANDDKWQRLSDAVPELRALAAQARTGRFRTPPAILDRSPPSSVEAGREMWSMMQQLDSELDPLLGPHSGTNDPLISSAYAREFAWEHLCSLSDQMA